MSSRLPELEPHCGSWIAVSRSSGTPVFETFTRSVAECSDQTKYEVLTAAQWLGRLNTQIRAAKLVDEIETPEMRERADAVVAEMRARWAAKDAETDKANRAFDIAFRKALRQPEDR